MKSRSGFVSNSSSSSFIIQTNKSADAIRQGFVNIFEAMYELSDDPTYKEYADSFDDYSMDFYIEDYTENSVRIYDSCDNGIPYIISELIKELFVYQGGFGADHTSPR